MSLKNPARHLSCGVFSCGGFYGLLLFCLLGQASQGQPAEPFSTRDQNPLVSIYGLPLPVNARLLPVDESTWISSFNLSNTLNVASSNNIQLRVDAESTQLNLVYAYGFSQNWALRLQGSVIGHRAGFLDSRIDNYHQLLGLKEGMRPYVETNQFQIYVRDGDNTLIDLQTSQTGLADMQIQLGTQLFSQADRATSLWASLKLPTGDSAKLTGSGATDVALWLATQTQLNPDTWLYADFGGLYMRDTDVLKPLHKHTAWFANLGISYTYNELLQFKTQIDTHTALYNTPLNFLGTAIQLTFGGSIILDKENRFDIAISEDIKTESSPDVTFNISWFARI